MKTSSMNAKTWMAAVVGSSLVVGTASAISVVNGDFEAGNMGFSSEYDYVFPSANSMHVDGYEGKYTVHDDVNYVHGLWTFGPEGDHTTGDGNMLIVNGIADDTKVWIGELTEPLTAGATYCFSAWVAGIYGVNPAELLFSVNGSPIGDVFTLPDAGNWHQITGTFVATASSNMSLVDLNNLASGNDFVVDDISLCAVPDGGSSLLLLAVAMVGVVRMKRKLA